MLIYLLLDVTYVTLTSPHSFIFWLPFENEVWLNSACHQTFTGGKTYYMSSIEDTRG